MPQLLAQNCWTTGRGHLTSRELHVLGGFVHPDDRESTPDPDALAYGVADGFEELPEIEQIPEQARF